MSLFLMLERSFLEGGIYFFDEPLNLSQLFSILFTEIKRGCVGYLKLVKKYQPIVYFKTPINYRVCEYEFFRIYQ